MEIAILNIGNSKGVVLPAAMLARAGLDTQTSAEVTVENGAIVLRKPSKPVRSGWAEAASALAQQQDDALLMGEFGDEGDAELTW